MFIAYHSAEALRKSVEEWIERVEVFPKNVHRMWVECAADSEHWHNPVHSLEIFAVEGSLVVDETVTYPRKRFGGK